MSSKETYKMPPILFGHLYQLANGDYVRIYSVMEDDECNYGYDYFSGCFKLLIDGGVFRDDDSINSEQVLETALDVCGCEEREYTFIGEGVEYADLEEMGFSGF